MWPPMGTMSITVWPHPSWFSASGLDALKSSGQINEKNFHRSIAAKFLKRVAESSVPGSVH